MFILEAADTLSGQAGSASAITATIYGLEKGSGGALVYKKLYQGQVPSSATTLYTAPASTETLVKKIIVANPTGGAVTIKLWHDGTADSNVILPAISIDAGGWAMCDDDGWKFFTATGAVKSSSVAGAHTHSHDTDLTGVSADDHHGQGHVLASGSALGPDHTISGAAVGEVLRALSATTAAFDQLGHGDLGGISADQHHARSHDHSTAGEGTALLPATLTFPGHTTPSQTAEGEAVWDTNGDFLTVGDGASRKSLMNVGDAAGGELAGTYPNPTVAATHGGSAHNAAIPRAIADAKGDLVVGTAADTVDRLAVGSIGQRLIPIAAESAGLKWVDHIVRKTADETVNNSTTLQNDDHLLWAVAANEVWFFEVFLRISSSAVADFKCGWGGVPTGATMAWQRWANLGGAAAASSPGALATETDGVAVGGVAGDFGLALGGWLMVGANAGTLNFQWAQNTAEATNTIVRANSLLRLTRLA